MNYVRECEWRERESVCVCACEREKERESGCVSGEIETAGVKKSPTCWQNSTLGSQIRFILERVDKIWNTCKYLKINLQIVANLLTGL